MTQPSGAPDDPVAGSRTFAAPPRGPCERCCALPVHHQFYALERDALAEISDLVEVSDAGRASPDRRQRPVGHGGRKSQRQLRLPQHTRGRSLFP